MKKIVIAPDSFKETFSSIEASQIIRDTLKAKYNYNYIIAPLSDGGEGMIDNLLFYNLIDVTSHKVTGPNFEKIKARIGWFKEGPITAIIESADVIGYKNQQPQSKAGSTTSFGLGELIVMATKMGAKKIYISLGGTITNDGGCGMLYRMGYRFINKDNKKFIPTGSTLKEIEYISNAQSKLTIPEIIGLTDVNNPLLGFDGATYTFAKQKRATNLEIIDMENGMKNFSQCTYNLFKKDYSKEPMTGSAGGISYSLKSFFNANLISGIKFFLDTIKFDELITGSSYVITGEGCLDKQSFNGKVISEVIARAKKANINLIMLVGKNQLSKELEDFKVYEINDCNKSFEEIKENKVIELINTVKKIVL